jgi:hypothetical protein
VRIQCSNTSTLFRILVTGFFLVLLAGFSSHLHQNKPSTQKAQDLKLSSQCAAIAHTSLPVQNKKGLDLSPSDFIVNRYRFVCYKTSTEQVSSKPVGALKQTRFLLFFAAGLHDPAA